MKKILKILEIIIISLIGLFTIFIFEESIRLEHYPNSKPLIIIDKIMCSKDDWICYGDDKKYTEEYYSIGFSLKMNYYLLKDYHLKVILLYLLPFFMLPLSRIP